MQTNSSPASPSQHGNVIRFESYIRPRSCEMLVRGRWLPVSVEDALEVHPDRLKRCAECLGCVQLAEADGGSHFVHRQPHAGCSRDAGFLGRRSRHPRAMT